MGQLLKVIRYKEWYDSKWNIYLYVLLLYCIRHQELDGWYCAGATAVVMIFTFSLLAFGYAFNDFSDAKEDLMVGKANLMAHYSLPMQVLILAALVTSGAMSPLVFSPTEGIAVVVALSFLMAFLYSYRRFGIKQRGMWGLAVSSLAQRVCPLFVIFYLFHDWSATSFMVALLSFIVGLRWILVHQAEDLANDKASHTKSFVSSLSNEQSGLLPIITLVFAAESLCLIAILILNVRLSWAVIIPAAYLLLQLVVLPFWLKVGWRRMILSYDFAPLADFYYLWAGIYIVVALAVHKPVSLVLLLPVMYLGYRYLVLDCEYIKLNYKAKRGMLSPQGQNGSLNE